MSDVKALKMMMTSISSMDPLAKLHSLIIFFFLSFFSCNNIYYVSFKSVFSGHVYVSMHKVWDLETELERCRFLTFDSFKSHQT